MADSISLSRTELQDAVDTLHRSEAKASVDFCKLWPTAKQVLELLAKVPKLGWIVALVIAVGEGYYNQHCKV